MAISFIRAAYAAAPDVFSQAQGCQAEGAVTIKGIVCLLKRVISFAPPLIALVAAFVIVFAGFKLITAGADPKAYASAWSTLTWAVIGIILMSVIWIVLVLIERLTGAPVTQFGIPNL